LVLNAEKRYQILGEMCQGGGKSSSEILKIEEKKRKRPPKG
jgi:hypothetical protein